MAEQQGTNPPTQPASPADGPYQAPPQSAPVSPPGSQASDPQKAERPTDPAQLVMREVADKLREVAASLTGTDRALAQQVNHLALQASDQVRLNQRSFQHDLAYAVQDVEKARGSQLTLSDQARAEVMKLAASAPGLENNRMQALLRSTAAVDDRGLVRDIRRAAADLGQQADQDTAFTRERIENLENRVRLGDRAAPAPDQPQTAGPTGNTTTGREPAADRPEQPNRVGLLGRPDQGIRPSQQPPVVVQTGFTGAVMDGVLRAMRPSGSGNTPPWEPGAQPFGQRLTAFRERGHDDETLRGAENSGRAALGAMEGFRNGEGAAVLNRIREAAKSDPGGMASVLSEMREGGKFADLRQQFNAALSDERGAAAAYDRAAGALARYGEDRKAVEQVIARRPDAANLSAKFETMDKEIGSAASEIPSRRDGKTMLDDLSKQVAEMLQRAVDSMKHLFRGPSAGPSPGVSPS